jgi:hypothetical protein
MLTLIEPVVNSVALYNVSKSFTLLWYGLFLFPSKPPVWRIARFRHSAQQVYLQLCRTAAGRLLYPQLRTRNCVVTRTHVTRILFTVRLNVAVWWFKPEKWLHCGYTVSKVKKFVYCARRPNSYWVPACLVSNRTESSFAGTKWPENIWYICLLQLGWHSVAVVHFTFVHKY